MVTDRLIEQRDYEVLRDSLAADMQHHDTTPDFFFLSPGAACKVYEDEDGPICFVKGTKALRLDIQYVSNDNVRRNMTAMLSGFNALAAKAKANGFTEIIFNTNSPLLAKFCVKRFGFVESQGELRKFL